MRAPAERTTPRPLHVPDPPALARITFVLVSPSHPGNVGAAARAMRTMGLSDLRLVAPRFPDVCARPEARAFASGADAVLDAARCYGTLGEAIGDAVLAVAVSAEAREFGPPPAPPEVRAAQAFEVLGADPAHRVAFVFGAERTGLSIDSVQACGLLASIPASPVYSSLNLAQALQIVAYCVRRAALDASVQLVQSAQSVQPVQPVQPAQSAQSPRAFAAASEAPDASVSDGPLADQVAVQGFLEHLERALLTIGFLDPAHPKKLMPRMRRLFLRARLRTEEVDLLRGICHLIERDPRR